MNRIIILLIIASFLSSCGQNREAVKTSKDKNDEIDNYSILFAHKKEYLDKLFLLHRDSADFKEQDMGTSLLIGSLFDTSHKDAVLRYEENDSIARVIVLRQVSERWDTIFSVRHNATSFPVRYNSPSGLFLVTLLK